MLSPPSERQLAQFLGLGGGDTLRDSALSKFYSMVGEKQAEDLRNTKEAANAPLHYKLRALLKLMMLEMQVCCGPSCISPSTFARIGDTRPARFRGSTGLAGVPTRPAGLPHPRGATSCRKAAPLTNFASRLHRGGTAVSRAHLAPALLLSTLLQESNAGPQALPRVGDRLRPTRAVCADGDTRGVCVVVGVGANRGSSARRLTSWWSTSS